MFSRDGTIHLASDKSSVLHEIEKVVEEGDIDETEGDVDLRKVIIFDGLAFVNKIKKSLSMKTCQKDYEGIRRISSSATDI